LGIANLLVEWLGGPELGHLKRASTLYIVHTTDRRSFTAHSFGVLSSIRVAA